MDSPKAVSKVSTYLVSFCLIFLCSCSTRHFEIKKPNPEQNLDLLSDEKIAVFFNSYSSSDHKLISDCTLEKSEYFHGCLAKAMLEQSPEIKILPFSDTQALWTPCKNEKCAPFNPDEDQDMIVPCIANSVETNALKYVILIDVIRTDSGSGFSGGSSYGGGTGALSWDRWYTLYAYVYDGRNMNSAGSFISQLEGSVVWFILPPIPLYSITEEKACKHFGAGLTDFLKGN